MKVYTAEGVEGYFVSSGSYTVNPDRTVSIIAEEACLVSEIDKDAAQAALGGAQVRVWNAPHVSLHLLTQLFFLPYLSTLVIYLSYLP